LALNLATSTDHKLDLIAHSLKPETQSFYMDYRHLLNIHRIEPFKIFSILNIGFGTFYYPILLDLRKPNNYELLICGAE
jgi:hypothetical protein